MQSIAVVGAAGSTGMKVCRAATWRGLEVVAIDRKRPELGADLQDIEFRSADVLNDDLATALVGCDGVISTLGLPFTLKNAVTPPPLYTRGTSAVVEGMRRREIRRLVVISAAFVVPQRALPIWFDLSVAPALHAILDQMRQMESLIARQDEIDWTITRPGWLLDRPAKGGLVVQDETLGEGAFRCREADLAAFLVEAVLGSEWVGRKPALGAPDEPIAESPLALGCALAGMLRSKA